MTKFYVQEVGPGGHIHTVSWDHETLNNAITAARVRLSTYPTNLVEAGYTLVVQDNAGRQVWPEQ